ncbi:MAG: DnaA N-terminal domain-containing protein, partial [Candidatus Omnitrophica bacterium]|nr:DnaA N-terminal domain-containing protein [Candidatus Omnitrophota bacterium]
MSDASRIWADAADLLKGTLGETAIQTWINPLKPKQHTGLQLVLEAPDAFFKDWVEQHYRKDIEDAVRRSSGKNMTVAIEAQEKASAGM